MVNNELMFLIFALSVKFFKRQLNREVDKGYDRSIYRTNMHGQQSWLIIEEMHIKISLFFLYTNKYLKF